MTDGTDAWASGLGLPLEQADMFARLAAAVGSGPAAILRLTVERVVEMDWHMRGLGLKGIANWTRSREAAGVAVEHGPLGVPLDVRPTGFVWPPDVPFPWSAEDCRTAVLGNQAHWKGSSEDFYDRFRGRRGMSDGYV